MSAVQRQKFLHQMRRLSNGVYDRGDRRAWVPQLVV